MFSMRIFTVIAVIAISFVIQAGSVAAMQHQAMPAAGTQGRMERIETDSALDRMTENRLYRVEMTIPEAGFSVGINSFALKVRKADGIPVTGAEVTVTPWMPGMRHGVAVDPEIRENGAGIYQAEQVGFSMPGHWQLRVSIAHEGSQDMVVFEFPNIPGRIADPR